MNMMEIGRPYANVAPTIPQMKSELSALNASDSGFRSFKPLKAFTAAEARRS